MFSLKLKSEIFEFRQPLIMGIVNVNEDSFYKYSRVSSVEDAYKKISLMFEEGADIIDIGAMSSRSGADLISVKEEWKRLEPVLKIIQKKFSDKIFSLDTINSETAHRAISDYGIDIINDISSGEIDTKIPEIVAEYSVPYIIMHMRGVPATMNNLTQYENFPGDIIKYFSEKINFFHSLGIHDIIIDPGFGFSKTLDQNYILLKNLDSFKIFERPILVGISRKSMIYRFLNITPEESLNATTALHAYCLEKGANILRVHDVKEAQQVVELFLKLKDNNIFLLKS
ncbi:MAG TPA: dihydropteroate synthase [Bacteroidales bacterium]|nr:dihydropteroate synthase [Bacteroidales bacterium]HOL98590.1 dihydropteroate synthase [Bacteroidales bacterium]HOM36916.1 dihydropteroate synthase [Bacteroidales bacterium]HPD24414.1 dihydropteroate synthase [Bacteroidales bacterium]HRT00286.1 dihydropteroate synthase [Bacteroidales bacterium]